MNFPRWLLVNGIFTACVFAGYGAGVTGAAAVATFMIWVTFLITLLGFIVHNSVEPITKHLTRPPEWLWRLDYAFDCGILGVIVWNGHWFLGLLYLFHMIVIRSMYPQRTP